MNETLALMEEKNHFLEKFIQVNSQWLEKLSQDDFSELEQFRETRENILNIVKHIDGMLEERFANVEIIEDVNDKVKEKVGQILERKDLLVRSILSQDLDIMEIIEDAKSSLITELKKTTRIKKTYSYGK